MFVVTDNWEFDIEIFKFSLWILFSIVYWKIAILGFKKWGIIGKKERKK